MPPPRRLPIAREGWPYILPALALSAALAAFFRDPERRTPPAPDTLYAPSDGRVILIEEIEGHPFIGGPAWRVATFLSLLDVHINRSPAAGVVRLREHVPGQFKSAWDPGVELANERTTIGIETERGPIVVVQIAGLVARRIVTYPAAGEPVGQGERIGLIKFGSRTDLLFPRDAARPLVRIGERVRGALTPLGIWC